MDTEDEHYGWTAQHAPREALLEAEKAAKAEAAAAKKAAKEAADKA